MDVLMNRTLTLTCTLTTEAYGLAINNPTLWREICAANSIDAEVVEEELAARPVESVMDANVGVLLRDPATGLPAALAYQIKGAFKDFANIVGQVKGTQISRVPIYRRAQIIDGLVRIEPRFVVFRPPPGVEFERHKDTGRVVLPIKARTLRANTPQGPRTTGKASEVIPAGSTFTFDVTLLTETVNGEKVSVPVVDNAGQPVINQKTGEPKMVAQRGEVKVEDLIREWMNYTVMHGWLGWRNAGWGTSTYTLDKVAEAPSILTRDWCRKEA